MLAGCGAAQSIPGSPSWGLGGQGGRGFRQENTVDTEYLLYLIGFLAGDKSRTDPNYIIENGHMDILGFKTNYGNQECW